MKLYTFYIFLILIAAVRILSYFGSTDRPSEGAKVRITSTLSKEPRDFGTSYLIEVESYRAFIKKTVPLNLGDQVVIEGKIEGSDTLSEARLMQHDISSNPIYIYRTRLLDFIGTNLPEKDAALIAGMVLGSGKFITREFWDSLVSTSTAHVVVASGMNVNLVAGFVLSNAIIIGRKRAVFLSLFFVWFYVFFAGFEAPLVRAGIMGSLFLLSQTTGRQAHTLYLLLFTCLTMLIIKPGYITDFGFILSVCSTLSLILFASKVYKKLSFIPVVIRENLSTSIAAQIGVGPILFFGFGNFNIFGPIINAFVLWSVPFITIFGMIASLAMFISPKIAKLIFLLTYPLTQFFVQVVGLFA